VIRATRAAAASIMVIAALSTAAASTTPRTHVAVPTFVEEAVAAGVEQVYDGSWEFFVGGGVAVLDCDRDGRPDLYFAGGSSPAALFANRSDAGGALQFERVSAETTDLTRVTGAYPLDIDSDGILDLAVLRHGEDVLLRGLGSCAFERANESWGFDGGDDWTTAFSATWEPGQSSPTLALGTYIDHVDDEGVTWCGLGSFVRPLTEGGGFAPREPLEPSHCALSMLFSDWSRSGRRDLRVSNDRHYYREDGEEQLWGFETGAPPRLYGHDEGWRSVSIWGMGIASQDLTGDGLPEVYLTNIGSNRLETLAGDGAQPTYDDIAHARGVTATTPVVGRPVNPSTSWHPEFDDVNNDGHMDLYISKGNVDAIPDNAQIDPSELFLGRPDGTFLRAAKQADIIDPARTRGAALVDLNADGLLDIVEVHRVENVTLRRNLGRGDAGSPTPMGHWLGVKLEQVGANPDGVGAWIEVKAGKASLSREVTVGGGHAGGELGPVHFGLGDRTEARVRVTWPDGEQGEWQTVPADAIVTVEKAASLAGAPGSDDS
jgi:hypothetical protein